MSSLSDESRRSSGSAFQAIRLATENARWPSVLRRCRGTTRWWRLEDRIADDWQRPMWGGSSSRSTGEPCLGYTGELSLRAYGGFTTEHRASAARSGADVSSLGHFPVLLTTRAAEFSKRVAVTSKKLAVLLGGTSMWTLLLASTSLRT